MGRDGGGGGRERGATGGPRYRVWPRFAPDAVQVTDPRHAAYTFVAIFVVAAVFWIPAVERATGIPSLGASALILSYAVWVGFDWRFLWNRARRKPGAFHLLLAGDLILGLVICLGLVLLGHKPETPLWALFCIFAAFNGAMHEVDASFAFLALHAGTPLLAIPFFLASGGDPTWSIAGPAMGCGFSLMAYHFMAMRADLTRMALRERDHEGARAQVLEQDLERRQLARDLHDSVGSALSLFGLCGDLIQRHRDSPIDLDRIAIDLRDSAREGIGDLRCVLDAMAPVSGDLDEVSSNLRRAAARLAATSGALVELRSGEGTSIAVDGPARVALVRVFQEAATNALRHGLAKQVRASLLTDGYSFVLTVSDDGVGFDPAGASTGRGLTGMRSRARDLGGTLDIASAAGAGALVTLRLPLTARA